MYNTFRLPLSSCDFACLEKWMSKCSALRSTIGRAKEVTNLERDLVGCGVATRVQAWNNPKKEENAQVSVLESRLVINLSLYDNAHRNRSKHYLFFACPALVGLPICCRLL